MSRFFLLLVILILPDLSFAQTIKGKQTLEDCIRIATRQSPAANIARNRYESSLRTWEAFNAGYYPQLNINGSVPGLTRAISQVIQPDGSQLFLPQSQLYSQSMLTLSQKIPFTGGEFYISSGISRIDILENNENMYWRTTPVQFTFVQPLFRHNSQSWDREIESLRYNTYDRKLVENIETVSMEIAGTFFDVYLQYMSLKNTELNVAINDTLYRISKGRFNVGKIAENDLLQNELGLANSKNDLEITKLDYQRAMEDLIISLGLTGITEIEIEPPLDIPSFSIDADKALKEALANRSDPIDFRIRELEADERLNIAEFNNSFNANLIASFGMNKSASSIPLAYQELLEQERLDLTFSVPLFQWNKGGAEVESALANREITLTQIELDKRNFELEVKYQSLRLEQLQKQVESQKKANIIAERRFDVAKNRYLIGKIDLNTFFIAQNEKDSALRSYIQTLRNFWVSYYRLRRLTLYDFENDVPLVKK